jgi:hypothetical protein
MMKSLSLPCCNNMFSDDPRMATGECVRCSSEVFWAEAAWDYYKVPIIIGAVLLLFVMKR